RPQPRGEHSPDPGQRRARCADSRRLLRGMRLPPRHRGVNPMVPLDVDRKDGCHRHVYLRRERRRRSRREQMSSVVIEEFDVLRESIAGELHVPGDASWDAARTPWNLAADQHPAAVMIAASAQDVAQTVRFASEHGYGIAAQGTGHAAASLAGRLEGTILVRTNRMRGVEIDPRSRGARADAGALWMDVTSAAAEHGLAALAGSSPDVGVVGYTLGGGLSWLSRTYGIAANSVTAIEVVTADGELVRADSRREPELFWALRGGGGNFGIVTAIEFTLYPVTEA